MTKSIGHSRPTLGASEKSELARVASTGFLARGTRCDTFEKTLASIVSMPYAHATTSGTAAIHLGLLALGAKSGTKVLLPSLCCAAVLNAVHHTGAEPILYDSSYQMVPAAALAKHVDANTVAAIVVAPSHGFTGLAGFEADPSGHASVASVPIVLDRCQQLSADDYLGPRARIEVFSFYATKCICTASGGALAGGLLDIERIVDLNTHDQREVYTEQRYNYQFDDLRASLGLTQLDQLQDFVDRRRIHANAYDAAFIQNTPTSGICFRYLYDAKSKAAADALIAGLAKRGIEAKRPVFKPLHRYFDLADEEYPLACDAWGRFVSLPIYPSLSDGERQRIIDAVTESRGSL